jgi:hypothetical protein
VIGSSGGVRFARIVYLVAGIVGLLEMVPLYFMESTINRMQPPTITHPEFYYGFCGYCPGVASGVSCDFT